MPIPVTVTVVKKVVIAASVGATTAEFKKLVPSGSLESVEVHHNARNLLPKERKELAAFCGFARQRQFSEVIKRLAETMPGEILNLEVLSSARNEDPPDLILTMGPKRIAIEVTDFPPDREAMQKAMAEYPGAAPLPLFHESGCSPHLIKQFMAAGVNYAEPHAGDLSAEILALFNYARTAIGDKDSKGKCELLLLYGPAAFAYPEADVIGFVTAHTMFKSIKAVVFVLSNELKVFWTNLA